MAKDSVGNTVSYGDVLIVTIDSVGKKIVTIVKISESSKGISATGAYVDLEDGVRAKKVDVNVAQSTLIWRADGTAVEA